jgi:hypothetical protein
MGWRRRDYLYALVALVGVKGGAEIAQQVSESSNGSPRSNSNEDPTADDFSNEDSPESGLSTKLISVDSSSPEIVSTDRIKNAGTDKLTITLENTGVDGNIKIRLEWATGDKRTPSGPFDEDFEHVSTKSLYFSENERRMVEFNAEPPESATGYYFHAETDTRMATLKNEGSGENVRVVLSGSMTSEVAEKTVFVGEGETKEVVFDGEGPLFGSEWEIEITPPE